MTRFSELLERYQDGEETAGELGEFSQLLVEEPSRGRQLYDAMMLETDLYESYAGIAQIRTAPKAAPRGFSPRTAMAWALAAFVLIGLAIMFIVGRNVQERRPELPPGAPRVPKPKPEEPAVPELKKTAPEGLPAREHDEHERRDHAPEVKPGVPDRPSEREHDEHERRERASKAGEAEREYQKGLREVERKRLQGKTQEADEKLREIEREREKKLRERDREHD